MIFKNKISALKWWAQLERNKQQIIANKYYSDDDFFVTDRNNARIEQIYLKENEEKLD